jgi:hypothetical protein
MPYGSRRDVEKKQPSPRAIVTSLMWRALKEVLKSHREFPANRPDGQHTFSSAITTSIALTQETPDEKAPVPWFFVRGLVVAAGMSLEDVLISPKERDAMDDKSRYSLYRDRLSVLSDMCALTPDAPAR